MPLIAYQWFNLYYIQHTRYERPNESHMMQLAFGMAIKWFEICFFFSRVLSKLVAHWCETAAHLCVGNEIGSSIDVEHTECTDMSCDRCPSIIVMLKSDNLWLNCDFSNFKLIINWQLRFHFASNHVMWASLVLFSPIRFKRTFVYWFISFEGKFIDFSFWLCAACIPIYDIFARLTLTIYLFPISVERRGCGITSCTCFFLSSWIEGKRKIKKKNIQKGERDLTAQTVYILLHIFPSSERSHFAASRSISSHFALCCRRCFARFFFITHTTKRSEQKKSKIKIRQNAGKTVKVEQKNSNTELLRSVGWVAAPYYNQFGRQHSQPSSGEQKNSVLM